MIDHLLRLLFPPKCVLCGKLLEKEQKDICPKCQKHTPEFHGRKKKISFIAGWTAVWYYEGNVRESLVRYKFHNKRNYAITYGKFLALQLTKDQMTDFDILTWVPVSAKRKRKRGYDQVQLLAEAVGKQLQVEPLPTLHKHRHTAPQSTQKNAAGRKANVLGAYRAVEPASLCGKRILLLDDIITTGATASECARVLLVAGAKKVYCAAMAAAYQDKNK